MEIVIQLLAAFCGSLGFAVLFHMKKDKLFSAAFGGFLGWAAYLLAGFLSESDVFRYFLASVFFTLYSEIMARRRHTPTTIFVVPAAIPLIPGGSLYETMRYMVQGNQEMFQTQGIHTILLAGAIAFGILCGMTLWTLVALLAKSLRLHL